MLLSQTPKLLNCSTVKLKKVMALTKRVCFFQECYVGWKEEARKNKRAKQRWLNRSLSNCFDLWFLKSK